MKTRALFFATLLSWYPMTGMAQDVVVGEPVWEGADAPPEEMPKTKSRLRVEFPEEMRKTTELGYVIVNRYVDTAGKSMSMSVVGTHLPYQRVVREEVSNWTMTAAKRGGQPIEATIWAAIIFNPKSAALKGPDATPRLLAVTPVFTAERLAPSGQPPVVRIKFSLDATGAVVQAQPETPLSAQLAKTVAETVKSWRFTPARKDGQAVPAEMVVPVLCQPPVKPNSPKIVPPRAVSREAPSYPVAMRRFGLTGQVTINFEVDVDGKVVNPVIHESENPGFDAAALEALLRWKFQPGTSNGKPAKMKLQVPVVFQLNGIEERKFMRVEERGDPAKLPPGFQYDIAPKFRGVHLPVHPFEAREAGASGKAVEAMLINPSGRVSQVKVLSADRPEFGLALTAAVEGFRFEPAYKDGKPVPHLMRFEQEFSSTMMGGDDQGLMGIEKRSPERIINLDALDKSPAPLSRRAPVFPVQVPEGTTQGEAVIEFLIDKEGNARLPRIVSASDPAFGYAGVQAVSTWLFEPPRAGGKVVVARARVPLVFSTKSANPAPKPASASEAAPEKK